MTPEDVDIKYEATTDQQLRGVLSEMAANARQQANVYRSWEEPWPLRDQQTLEDTWKKQRSAEHDYLTNMCPNLEPLLEEVMFRFSYVPYTAIQWHEPLPKTPKIPDPATAQAAIIMQQSLVRRMVLGCENRGGYGYMPPLEDVANGLDMLGMAMDEGMKRSIMMAPFSSRNK